MCRVMIYKYVVHLISLNSIKQQIQHVNGQRQEIRDRVAIMGRVTPEHSRFTRDISARMPRASLREGTERCYMGRQA